MKCHEVDYEIFGNELQLIEVELDPQEIVIAEAGAMNYIEEDIAFDTKLGDGSNPDRGFFGKVFDMGKRIFTGESLFMTHFKNDGEKKRRVSFAAPYPGKIIPLNLSEFGETIFCQKGSFLAAAFGTQLSIAFHKRFGTGFFGGEGFILQKLIGDGMAFIHAGGTVVKKELNGETLRIDTGCLVAFTQGIDYSIERAGSLKTMLFGGEGVFLATLKGHGTVWLQSLPFSRLANTIIAHAPRNFGKSQGESSLMD